jgi:hypothetical protein
VAPLVCDIRSIKIISKTGVPKGAMIHETKWFHHWISLGNHMDPTITFAWRPESHLTGRLNIIVTLTYGGNSTSKKIIHKE